MAVATDSAVVLVDDLPPTQATLGTCLSSCGHHASILHDSSMVSTHRLEAPVPDTRKGERLRFHATVTCQGWDIHGKLLAIGTRGSMNIYLVLHRCHTTDRF